MPTQCSRDLFGYEVVAGRQVMAAFDGGDNTSDAGGLLLGATDRTIGLTARFAACFLDDRAQAQVEHTVKAMVAQRVFGIALGYEDLIDHDQLRHDPVLATLAGKLEAKRKDCAPLAGKSTLNRLEHASSAPSRYHKIGHDGAAIEGLFVDLFLEAYTTPPKEIVLDLDATDDPLHGHQEGRFFHGYYGPAIAICRCTCSAAGTCSPPNSAAIKHRCLSGGRPGGGAAHRSDPRSLAAGEDPAPRRFGFCPGRGDGVVRGERRGLRVRLGAQRALGWRDRARSRRRERRVWLKAVQSAALLTSPGARSIAGAGSAGWSLRPSTCPRGPNPRFIVTSLPASAIDARTLYEAVYCARGEVENRIKEQQLDLFADRTSAATMRANQLRLWFASCLCAAEALRRIGLGTPVCRRDVGTIRLKLLKIGARRSPHQDRHGLSLPLQAEYHLAYLYCGAPPPSDTPASSAATPNVAPEFQDAPTATSPTAVRNPGFRNGPLGVKSPGDGRVAGFMLPSVVGV